MDRISEAANEALASEEASEAYKAKLAELLDTKIALQSEAGELALERDRIKELTKNNAEAQASLDEEIQRLLPVSDVPPQVIGG